MKKNVLFVGLFIIITMLASVFAFAVEPKKNTVTLSVSSDTVKQGGIIAVTIHSEKPLEKLYKSVQLYVGNQLAPIYRQTQTESAVTYSSWVGVGVDDKTGTIPVALKLPTGQFLTEPQLIVIQARNFGKQNIAVSKTAKGLEPIAGEMEAIGHLKSLKTPTKYWQFPFVSPTPECENSPFGVRRYHNGKYSGNYHKGVDLKSPQGRAIKAIQAGVVIIATSKFRLHGGTVGIDHGAGVASIYIHQSKVAVKPGDIVKAGQTIGYVGSTGFAMGPHLHWGLYVNGTPVDPNLWVPYKRC